MTPWMFSLIRTILTSAVKKTKTQAQNSSQKLKKKTQALGGFFQNLKKLKKKLKIECFSGGWYTVCHFYCQICSKTGSFILKDPKVSKFVQKFLKLRGKFPKLKKKTQNSRKKLKLWEDFAPPERPSGVIKKA